MTHSQTHRNSRSSGWTSGSAIGRAAGWASGRRGLAAVLIAGLAVSAAAQPTGRPRRANQPAPTQPAAPAQPASPAASPGTQPGGAPATTTNEEPTPGEIVQRGRTAREWTLTARVNIRAYFDSGVDRPQDDPRGDQMPTIERFQFDTMTLVWPIVPRTASSEFAIEAPVGETPLLEAYKFTVDDRDATGLREFEHEILTAQAGGQPYHSGVWLALLKLGRGIDAREVDFEVAIPSRSWETTYDEEAALAVAWPEGAWPAEAAATLQPMAFVDSSADGRRLNDRPIRDLLTRWTDGKDPRTIAPATFAKWIAGRVLEHVQMSGSGLNATRNGLLEGVGLQLPADTALLGRGSEFDMVVLLAAVYRMAGLPARIVIGYDTKADVGNEPGFLESSGGAGDLCAWVEFCLYDEPTNTINWVPVDIVRMRKQSSRLPENYMNNRNVRYFGTCPDLDDVIPLALQFHPPTTVRAYGSPGFWGWFVTPTAPDRAWQSISIRASTTPRRGTGR